MMLTLYILVALVTVVAICIAVYWSRFRSGSRDASKPETNADGPATVVRVDTRAEFPDTATRLENFDPGATLVYKRSSHDSAHAAPKKRDDVGPVAPNGARLIGLSGAHRGTIFPIVPAGITIGRSLHCDVVLVDHRASSRHAWIGFVDDKAMLRDLKSTNGTFLNAQMSSPVTETPLRSGDTIFFGGHQGDQFRFVAD